MGPSHDDDEEFLHSIICEVNLYEQSFQDDAPDDDGIEYLNDTSDGDAEQPEIVEKDVGAKVYAIRAYINMI